MTSLEASGSAGALSLKPPALAALIEANPLMKKTSPLSLCRGGDFFLPAPTSKKPDLAATTGGRAELFVVSATLMYSRSRSPSACVC